MSSLKISELPQVNVLASGSLIPVANGSTNEAIDIDDLIDQINVSSGSGDVTGPASSTDNAVARFNATTGKIIQNSSVTIDDSGNIATSGTVNGRNISVDGTKLDSIENGADITDATNVDAAGAVMNSDYTPSHSLLVQQSGTGSPSSLSVSNNSFVGKQTGDIVSLSASTARSILNVEDGADVTDATNVAAAGAVMASAPSISGTLDCNNQNIQEVKSATFNGVVSNGSLGASKTIDWGSGNMQSGTLSADCTFTFTAPAGPAALTLFITQDSTPRTITWPASVLWSGGTDPTISTGSGAVDVITFVYNGTNYFGVWSGDFS